MEFVESLHIQFAVQSLVNGHSRNTKKGLKLELYLLKENLHIQITVESFVIDTLQTKKVSITEAVLTLEN